MSPVVFLESYTCAKSQVESRLNWSIITLMQSHSQLPDTQIRSRRNEQIKKMDVNFGRLENLRRHGVTVKVDQVN